eukprot:SM000040S14771  [mRNA]  locus=s40:211723:212542:- [translate_table: standard]
MAGGAVLASLLVVLVALPVARLRRRRRRRRQTRSDAHSVHLSRLSALRRAEVPLGAAGMAMERRTRQNLVAALIALPLIWWAVELTCKPFLDPIRKRMKKDLDDAGDEDDDI